MKKLYVAAIAFLFTLLLAACDEGAQVVPTGVATSSPSAIIAAATPSDVPPTGTVLDATATSPAPDMSPSPVPATSTPAPSATLEASATPVAQPTIAPTYVPTVVASNTAVTEPAPSPSGAPSEGIAAPHETATPGRAVTGIGIDYPSEGAQVTFPLHVQARTGRSQSEVVLKLKWKDGQELSDTYTVIKDKSGNGWVVDSLDYMGESAPPDWKTQPATLQMLTTGGTLLASRQVQYLSDNDPNTQYVKVAFLLGEESHLTTVHIIKTKQIATAALNELLWGVGPRNFAGFTTSLPTPEEVIAYKNPGPNWGPRVTLRQVTIVNGVATADFSSEMLAYGGGSARVAAITGQITQTLKQFSTVKEVRILVDGKPNALQP